MAFITRVKTWVAEALLFGDLNTEFNNIISGTSDGTKDVNVAAATINGALVAKSNVTLGNAASDTITLTGNVNATATNIAVNVLTANSITVGGFDLANAIIPLGSIIPWYPFSANLSIDANYWAYCNGQTKTINGVSETLPDLSGRYLVGFGAPNGGGDLASATWATAAVGQVANTANIAHTHTGPSHVHSVAKFWNNSGHIGFTLYKTSYGGANFVTLYRTSTGIVDSATGAAGTYGGTVATGDDAVSDAAGTGATGSALSATHDVRPNSIRVRYIMRIK